MKQFPLLLRECSTYQEWWHWGIPLLFEKSINENFYKGNFLLTRNGGNKGFLSINASMERYLQSARVLTVYHNCYIYDLWEKKITKQSSLCYFSHLIIFSKHLSCFILFLWNDIAMNQLFQFNCYYMVLSRSFLHVTYPSYQAQFFWLDENVAV